MLVQNSQTNSLQESELEEQILSKVNSQLEWQENLVAYV